MILTTSRGKSFPVNWAWSPTSTGQMMVELPETRHVAEIAADFDGLDLMQTKDLNEGDRDHKGYTRLVGVVLNRSNRTAQLTFEKE